MRNLVIDSKILVNRLDRRFDTAEERIRSWNQDCWEKYQQPRYADNTTLMAEGEKGLKNLLMKVKEKSEKVDLQLKIQKTKIMASGPITS